MKEFFKSFLAVVLILVVAISMFGPEINLNRPSGDDGFNSNIATRPNTGIIIDSNGNIIYYPEHNEVSEGEQYLSELREYGSNYNRAFRLLTSSGSADGDIWFGDLGDRYIMHGYKEYINCAAGDMNVWMECTCVSKDSFVYEVKNAADSGEALYDIVIPSAEDAVRLAQTGYLLNLNYCDPLFRFGVNSWWNEEILSECSFGDDSLFFVTGEFTPGYFYDLNAVICNWELAWSLGFDPYEFEAAVIDGEWTYDTLNQYCMNAYVDNDADGQKGIYDTLGLTVDQRHLDALSTGAGVTYVKKTSYNDFFRGSIGDEESLTLSSRLKKLFYTYGAAILSEPGYYTGSNIVLEGYVDEVMRAGNSLFTVDTLGSIVSNELYGYSVLPMPMLDEDQGGYITPYSSLGTLYAIPSMATDARVSAAFIESMAIRAYFGIDNVEKFKTGIDGLVSDYLHNGDATTMMNFITENVHIGYERYLVSSQVPEYTNIFRNAILFDGVSISSTVRTYMTQVDELLNRINDTY